MSIFRRGRRDRRDDPAEPGDVYAGLREQILGLDPNTVRLGPTPGRPRVWGGLMETGYPHGTATVVALADGTTSLYTSSGFGIIGGGAHPSVVAATRAFLDTIEAHLEQLPPSSDTTLPGPGQVMIRALTHAGPRVTEAAEDDLGHGRHPLAPVFHAGHDVLTELRLLHERTDRS